MVDLDEMNKICTFALDNYGFYYNGKQHYLCILEYKYIRYSKKDSVIVFSTSKDGLVWEDIYEYTLGRDIKLSDLNIAIDFSLGVYTMDLWKNMNFIQLFYTDGKTAGRVRMDYFMLPKKILIFHLPTRLII